ncbi:MAG TPA: ComEA family DNA-binding protein [Mycobacteriales bacterium]|nr:ComEA family DNA-binding protein [Mycobacteriales bacterium]
MPGHGEETARAAADRLSAMGLAARPSGWVPDQPPELRRPDGFAGEPPAALSVPADAPRLPSRLDLVRLAAADRLPAALGDRLRAMSSQSLVSLLVAVVAVAISVGLVVHDHRRPASYAQSYPAPQENVSPSTVGATVEDGSSIVVDVAGAVRHPGLVTLPVGARVDDAITAAGGPTRPAVLARTNLAARVSDGELLVVGRAARHGGSASGGLISLSTASMAKLETLPGVGPVTAQKIVDWRNAHGGFSSVEQLQQVSGIGPTRYAELSPLVSP